MKCPKCWAYEAYTHHARGGWKELLLSCLLLIPMKCQHCFHKFYAFWPFTLGQQMAPPTLRVSKAAGPSLARDTEADAAPAGERKKSHDRGSVAEVRRRSRAA